jgi:hypothetical protein
MSRFNCSNGSINLGDAWVQDGSDVAEPCCLDKPIKGKLRSGNPA